MSTNDAVRPREDCKVGAVSECEEEEGRKPQKMQNPLKPTEAEVKEHNLTHLPYRSWCRHCVRGRGKEMPHRKLQDEAGMPEVYADLCFLGDEADPGNTVPVFVMRERLTGMTLAAAVPSKSTNSHIARRIVAFMREIGVAHGHLLVRTDQGPRSVALSRRRVEFVLLREAVGTSSNKARSEAAQATAWWRGPF